MGLLQRPHRLQRQHAVHGPSGVVLARCRRTTPARLLGSCVRAPATASTPSIMPARVHGPSGVVSPSCIISPTLIYKVHVVRHDSSLPMEFAGNGNG